MQYNDPAPKTGTCDSFIRNSKVLILLCCTTYKSVFDTPNKSVTFTPKIR